MDMKQRIDAVLDGACRDGTVAGIVAAAANADGTLYEGSAGVRLLGAPQAMTPDTVFLIASMTKAITGAAAMQLVEQGRLSLDEPLGRFAATLQNPQVLEGFTDAGNPILRPARGIITLRHLMTHTAGFTNDIWNPDMRRHGRAIGIPGARTGLLAALDAPLMFDPGARWEYSIGIDWIGRVVEAVSGENLETYLREHLFAPLGMHDTTFVPNQAQVARGAGTHQRQPDGSLQAAPFQKPEFAEFFPGGGGLSSTGPDYIRFLRALLNGGSLDAARVLKPETVALMGQNHMGALDVLPMISVDPATSADVELFAGMSKKWGLSFLINTQDVPGRRSAGSLCWAGIRNTHFWLDPQRNICGVLMTQLLPFAEPRLLTVLENFEAAIYAAFA